MNLSNIVASVLSLADKIVPLIPGGGPIVAIGEAVAGLVAHTKEIAGTTDQAALQTRLDVLQAAVNAHADRTISSLGG